MGTSLSKLCYSLTCQGGLECCTCLQINPSPKFLQNLGRFSKVSSNSSKIEQYFAKQTNFAHVVWVAWLSSAYCMNRTHVQKQPCSQQTKQHVVLFTSSGDLWGHQKESKQCSQWTLWSLSLARVWCLCAVQNNNYCTSCKIFLFSFVFIHFVTKQHCLAYFWGTTNTNISWDLQGTQWSPAERDRTKIKPVTQQLQYFLLFLGLQKFMRIRLIYLIKKNVELDLF